jgi:hypothetical protein
MIEDMACAQIVFTAFACVWPKLNPELLWTSLLRCMRR